MPVKQDRRRYMREYMRRYREQGAIGKRRSSLPSYLQTDPNWRPTGGTTPNLYQGTLVNAAQNFAGQARRNYLDEANKKMQEAYAYASYKRGRRSPTRVSNQTIHNYFQEKEKEYADKVASDVKRHKAFDNKKIRNKKIVKQKEKQGLIPRALKSYGSYYKIGAKSIGRSALKAKKKAANFIAKLFG